MDIGSIIDTAARDRVVILISPPTRGRDLDLLIRAPDRRSIEHAVRSHGYRPAGRGWARLNRGVPEVVEWFTPGNWALPDRAVEDVFGQAVPRVGHSQLWLPSPGHQLLILAGKLRRRSGRLSQKHRNRMAEALRR